MKSKVKKLIILTMSITTLLGATLTVNAASVPNSSADTPTLYTIYNVWCPTCKNYTPFDDCKWCEAYDRNNPYHCRLCGKQMGHPDWTPCPTKW